MANVRAKKMTYLDETEMRTFIRWHPQIKVQGQWAFLRDPETKSGLREADDEETALEKAIEAYREVGGDVQDDR